MPRKFTSFLHTLWATRQVAEYPLHCFTTLSRVDEAMICEVKCMVDAINAECGLLLPKQFIAEAVLVITRRDLWRGIARYIVGQLPCSWTNNRGPGRQWP